MILDSIFTSIVIFLWNFLLFNSLINNKMLNFVCFEFRGSWNMDILKYTTIAPISLCCAVLWLLSLLLMRKNCDCGRIFSLIKNYWTGNKSNLSLGTIKSWLVVKDNLTYDCLQFQKFILSKLDYLKKVNQMFRINRFILYIILIDFFTVTDIFEWQIRNCNKKSYQSQMMNFYSHINKAHIFIYPISHE